MASSFIFLPCFLRSAFETFNSVLRESSRTVVTTEGDQRQTNIMLLKQFHAPNFVVLTMNKKNLDSQ